VQEKNSFKIIQEESEESEENAVVDVAVSFDRTWARRGFS
jgi:hypothetical protein